MSDSTNNPAENGDPTPHEFETISAAFSELEMVVRDFEPKVRELNRKFADALGVHPSSATGAWLYLAKKEDGQYFIAMEELKIADFSKLLWVLGVVSSLVAGAPKLTAGVEPDVQLDLGPTVVGEAAALTFVPTTHVRVKRGH